MSCGPATDSQTPKVYILLLSKFAAHINLMAFYHNRLLEQFNRMLTVFRPTHFSSTMARVQSIMLFRGTYGTVLAGIFLYPDAAVAQQKW